EIVGWTWEHNRTLAVILLLAALVTAYYTFRLYFRVFEGPEVIPPEPSGADDAHGAGAASAAAVQTGDTAESGVDEHLQTVAHQAATTDHGHGGEHAHHDHEPMIMIAPLILLAIGALVAGYLNWPGEGLAKFLGHSPSLAATYEMAGKRYPNGVGNSKEVNPLPLGQVEVAENRDHDVIEHEHSTHLMLMVISGLIALGGIGLAYQFHLKDRAAGDALPYRFPGIATVLENKYWVDEFYQAAFVEPLRRLGVFFYAFDRIVIDGLVWVVSFVPQLSGFALKLTTQRGYLQGYAGAMAFGIVIILLIVFW
ncbi:MAG TPA: hypothetical protein VH475_03495, partial [Tepidisphaeraceae bacterium]